MKPLPARRSGSLTAWIRKVHSYVGLYLLMFLWLFSASGLLLNHPTWGVTQYWSEREQTSVEVDIEISPPGTDLDRARNLMRQLGITGEIEQVRVQVDGLRSLEVRVIKPGRIIDITADLQARRAKIERIQVNNWGVIQWLHTFTGVRMDRPELKRDWVVTRFWSLALDAVCVGLLLLVATSLFLWSARVSDRKVGWLILGTGTLICCFFVFGLSWL